MRRSSLVPMLVTLLVAPGITHSARQTDEAVGDYGRYLGRDLTASELEEVRALLDNPSRELQSMAASVLYRSDPERYSLTLYEYFAVHDYRQREESGMVVIETDEFAETINAIESSAPELDKRLVMLRAFLHYRDKNLWVRADGRDVSTARYLRSAILASVFEGTSLDAAAVANELDTLALAAYQAAKK